MGWLQTILLAVGAVAALVNSFQLAGIRKALGSLREAIIANTASTGEATEHAERARCSAERAQASADVVGGYVRDLRDAARDVAAATGKSRNSRPSFTGEGRR